MDTQNQQKPQDSAFDSYLPKKISTPVQEDGLDIKSEYVEVQLYERGMFILQCSFRVFRKR